MKTAYILLWFPKPTETFVFREVVDLQRFGLPLSVYTVYGIWKKDLSAAMRAYRDPVTRLGIRSAGRVLSAVAYWYRRDPKMVRQLFRTAFLRRWRGFEKTGENLLCFLAGFELGRLFEADGIEFIHAPWANGPATAAWVAARLTGTPFAFTGRAWDIYPPDALITVKIADAAFVRCNNAANIRHLTAFAGGSESKFRLVYNGVPLEARGAAAVSMKPPVRLLAIGRLARSKGYEQLLRAVRILVDDGVDVRLTLVGAGELRLKLLILVRWLAINDRVTFTGFVPHQRVNELMLDADIFVMSSVVAPSGDRDGIPNVIMEALLHRLPVVATDVCGIPELIVDGETGLLVAERDPAALAEAIGRLVGDRDLAVSLAERGRTRVLEQFDPERNYRKVLDLIQSSGAVP